MTPIQTHANFHYICIPRFSLICLSTQPHDTKAGQRAKRSELELNPPLVWQKKKPGATVRFRSGAQQHQGLSLENTHDVDKHIKRGQSHPQPTSQQGSECWHKYCADKRHPLTICNLHSHYG